MEALGPLIAENLGVERASIEVREDGLRHCVQIGDSDRLRDRGRRALRGRDGRAGKLTGIFHPVGSELTISKATRSKINAFGIQYEGKAGFSMSQFAWAA